jgi:hypothetical protein
MRHVILATWLSLVLSHSAAGQTPLTLGERQHVVSTIVSYRQILEDSTWINFCAVPEFWDSTGVFIETRHRNFVRFKSRAECPAPASGRQTADFQNVSILSMRVFGDTLVEVRGTSKRGQSLLYEKYTISNIRKGPRSITYCITSITAE